MTGEMTEQLATEFALAWNSRDTDLVAGYFTEDAEFHIPVGPDHLGTSFVGIDEIRRGTQQFFDLYPDGRFENLRVVVAGDHGTFEWDFVSTGADGVETRTAGCDLLRFSGTKVRWKNAFYKLALGMPGTGT